MIYKLVIPVFHTTKESLDEEYEQKKYFKEAGLEETIDGILETTPSLLSINDVIIYTDGRLEVMTHYFDKYNEGKEYSKIVTPIDTYYVPLKMLGLSELIDKQMREQDSYTVPVVNKDLIPKIYTDKEIIEMIDYFEGRAKNVSKKTMNMTELEYKQIKDEQKQFYTPPTKQDIEKLFGKTNIEDKEENRY